MKRKPRICKACATFVADAIRLALERKWDGTGSPLAYLARKADDAERLKAKITNENEAT